ncbi:MAG: nucleotide sugar dehydrogenase [Desulfobacterales bacterium]|nr:nucleotide sugar dehydrogenase [Desulfobacterales bacterium]
MDKQATQIAVIGLGYVGLPVAVTFGRQYRTIGYDLKEKLIERYKEYVDPAGELTGEEMKAAVRLEYTADPRRIHEADVIIVAVPTPIDEARQPDLKPLMGASETTGRYMKKGAVVVFESTVYPGTTEDVCVPILERMSGFAWKTDFHVGYSPERINPGDKGHRLENILKIVSGDDEATLNLLAELYGSIITAGIYPVACIKEAEAAKVIENTQRDLNIALMNELAVIFDKLGIDTTNVLQAASTKWNFLPFRPGLVGGHCIGVDPYYLTFKAETSGYHPEVILAGRRINDNMGKYIAEKTVKLMTRIRGNIKKSKVAILGLTFKEDCADLRNTGVTGIIEELLAYGITPLVHDPLADAKEALSVYGISLAPWESLKDMDAVILAVGHQFYKEMPIQEYVNLLNSEGCIIDVKSIFDPNAAAKTGVQFWRL